jgi:hypothetical protein
MTSSLIYDDSNEHLLCILEKDVSIAYQNMAALDFNSTDEEITLAILILGCSLNAYRFFAGKGSGNRQISDCKNRFAESSPII